MSERLPIPRITFRDVGGLEARARALATGHVDEAAPGGTALVVTFRLRDRACAVEVRAVERAVTLAAPFSVPLADGSERAVAFVEERPLLVADLAGTAAGRPRRAEELAGAPALVVSTPAGPVAVAVQGPLELAEESIRATAGGAAAADLGLRISGRLAGGADLLDDAWLAAWARKAGSP